MENPFFRAMTRKTVATSEENVPENPFFRTMTHDNNSINKKNPFLTGITTSTNTSQDNPFFRGMISNTNNIRKEYIFKKPFHNFKKEDISKGGEAFLRAMACNSSNNIQEITSTAVR